MRLIESRLRLDRLEMIEFSRNFNAHLDLLNIRQETSGEYASNGLTAFWTARLVEPKKDGRTLMGSVGYYELGLYQIDAVVQRADDNQEVGQISTRVLGYEGVRLPRINIGG